MVTGLNCSTGFQTAIAQQPKPAGMSPETAAQRRFPQPVRVGALLGQKVLEPKESQPVLGHVKNVVRQSDGSIKIIVSYGGLLGFGARQIAVPVEAMALLGPSAEIVDLTPAMLDKIPTFEGGGTILPAGETIRVGLARPSH